ncbi:ATP-binding protein [Acidisoma sp.]|uniref:ATP-binding protein n=1 Tax=Acidisoma sp. TaxID=1872115 RepID=UPI003B001284
MIEFPPFRIDTPNQCVWRSTPGEPDHPVPLTPKAFSVLRYLAEHRSRIVSHEELLDALWPEVHVQPEVIKGHILAIRTALGDTARDPRYIRTIRSRGYKFIAAPRRGEADAAARGAGDGGRVIYGREQPLADLRHLLELATARTPQLVFMPGEAGIGKSALLDLFANTVAARPGVLVAIGRCIEGYGGIEPHYPLLEALNRLLRGVDGEVVLEALLTIAPTWAAQLPGVPSAAGRAVPPPVGVTSTASRMVREFADLVENISKRRPIVLMVEDAHWSDHSTIDVLSALARRRSNGRFLVIATYRPADAASQDHPVRRLHHELLLQGLCRELVLAPIGRDIVAEILGARESDVGALQLARALVNQSGGNPLFLFTILDNLAERKLITHSAEGWSLSVPIDDIRLEIPSSLAQVIWARAMQLDPSQRRALEAASVAGVDFNAMMTARASEMDVVAFEDVSESLVQEERFVERRTPLTLPDGTETATYAFKHSLYRDEFYARQGPLRRRKLHLAIADDLETLYPVPLRGQVAFRLAQHLAGAGEWVRALDCLREGLQTAKRRSAYRDALVIFDLGCTFARNLPQNERMAAEMEFLEGRAALYASMRDERAAQAYRDLATMAQAGNLVDVEVRALIGLAQAIGWTDAQASVALFEDALRRSARQTAGQPRARTVLSCYLGFIMVMGWSDERAAHCETALERLQAGPDALIAAWAGIQASQLQVLSGRYQQAHATVQDNIGIVIANMITRSETNVPALLLIARLISPWALLFSGQFARCAEELDASIALLRDNGNGYGSRTLLLFRAWLRITLGDFQAALQDCETAERASDTDYMHEPPRLVTREGRLHRILSGMAEMGLGHERQALMHYAAVQDAMARSRHQLDWYWQLLLDHAMVDLFLHQGDAQRSRTQADRFVEAAQQSREPTFRRLAFVALARSQLLQQAPIDALASIEQAEAVAPGSETPLATWRLHATAAAVHRALCNEAEGEARAEMSLHARLALLDTFEDSDPRREALARTMRLAVGDTTAGAEATKSPRS